MWFWVRPSVRPLCIWWWERASEWSLSCSDISPASSLRSALWSRRYECSPRQEADRRTLTPDTQTEMKNPSHLLSQHVNRRTSHLCPSYRWRACGSYTAHHSTDRFHARSSPHSPRPPRRSCQADLVSSSQIAEANTKRFTTSDHTRAQTCHQINTNTNLAWTHGTFLHRNESSWIRTYCWTSFASHALLMSLMRAVLLLTLITIHFSLLMFCMREALKRSCRSRDLRVLYTMIWS